MGPVGGPRLGTKLEGAWVQHNCRNSYRVTTAACNALALKPAPTGPSRPAQPLSPMAEPPASQSLSVCLCLPTQARMIFSSLFCSALCPSKKPFLPPNYASTILMFFLK